MNDSARKSPAQYAAAAVLFAAAVLLDQVTKIAAVKALASGRIPLLAGVLEFLYVENRGAAFGIFQNGTWFFTLTATIAIVILAVLYVKCPGSKRYFLLRLCLVMIGAGAAGNLIDRVLLHYVRDFIYFALIDFPVFNVADIYVTVCTFGLALLILFYYKDEELSFLSKGRGGKETAE